MQGSYIISGIDVYQEYLYIADSAQTTIHRVLLSTVQTQEESQEGDIEDFGPAFYGLSDVHVYTSSSSSGGKFQGLELFGAVSNGRLLML